MKKEMNLYWVEGVKTLDFLYENGFAFGSDAIKKVLTEGLRDGYAVVLSIDFSDKSIGFFPLEIYKKGSEKFNYWYEQCKSVENLKIDVLERVAK